MISRSWAISCWGWERLHLLVVSLDVADLHPLLELAGADAHKGDAVAVGLVHVRLDLEDEGGEPLVKRVDNPVGCRPGAAGGVVI